MSSGVCGARATERHLAHVSTDLFFLGHEKGVPGKVVAELMGHAKVDTALNVYTQVIDGAKRAAAQQVGGELFKIVHDVEGATAPTD